MARSALRIRRGETACLIVLAAVLVGLVCAGAYPKPAAADRASATGGAMGVDWGAVADPAPEPARAVGGYARGCLGGAVALPANGPGYQVMRLSRHRYYGHPRLIAFIETLAARAHAQGWPGLLVGDLAQARGGPTATGHASHQIGLDADLWFTPAPSRKLSAGERETMSARAMVAPGGEAVEAGAWGPRQVDLLRTAASFAEVERIFVNPAIKRAVCATAGSERGWLAKVRPWWGHTHHFHVRLACPKGEPACIGQDPLPAGDGCDGSLDWWFSAEAKAELARAAAIPKRPIALSDLPPACRGILQGG